MAAEKSRISPGQSAWIERYEWAFPVRGRWLRALLAVFGRLLALTVLICGLAVCEMVPHFFSARNLRVAVRSDWGFSEVHGPWDRTGSSFVTRLGPLRFDYRYPARGRGRAPEGVLELALQAALFGLVWLTARKVGHYRTPGRLTGELAVAGGLLLFPLATACGAMGCQTMQPWHLIWYGFASLISH
jgi:hypothetical protein